MQITIEVENRGGIFENPKRIVDNGVEDAMLTLGEAGQRIIRQRLDNVLVNPTGHYRSRIDYVVMNKDILEVHDSNVIYGPWLEGVGSRNASSRFKGYATFRKSMQDIEQRASEILEPEAKMIAQRLEKV